MFGRLNGMWAIVLLDLGARKLFISRDRFGIKPLFYHLDGSRLIIASEVKQLLAAGVPPAANASAVTRFIRGQRPELPEQTFFSVIAAQPAATYAEINLLEPIGDLTFKAYWRLAACNDQLAEFPSLDSACGTLDKLLTSSVAEHMVGPVPFGILISGGLDSSIVAALAVTSFAQRGERGMGISMVLGRNHGRYNETAHIDRVVSALNFRSFTAELTPAWLKANIRRITRAQEEPIAGVAAAGQFLAYELAAKQGAKVVLDGQGADELFGGYPRHQIAFLKDCVRRLAFVDLFREIVCLLRRNPGFFGDICRRTIVSRLRQILRLSRERGIDFIREGIDTTTARAVAVDPLPSLDAEEIVPNRTLSQTLRKDVLTGNLRAVLALTDRNSMAHSIEARVPYVDRRIVEFAFQLPDRYKVSAGQRKYLLRRLGARYLPQEIVARVDRIGFGAPIHQWLMQDFCSELKALPDGPVFSASALIDKAALRRFIDKFLSGHHHDSGTIWRIYAIDQWARAYAVTGI